MDIHVNTEEETISEVGAYAAHNFKRRKLITRRNTIESLPDDVMIDILARVPVEDIYHAARLVCSTWYQTIRTPDFARAHLQRSTRGLLIQHDGSQSNKQILFATQKKCRGTIEKHNFVNKFTGVAFSSCNGLILERHNKKEFNKLEFRITNPATNQHLDLPSFGPDHTAFYNAAIAYAAASKEYKVVRSFYPKSGGLECAILTVGVDKDWERRVDVQHLSPAAKKLLVNYPSSTQGFVHWAHNGTTSGRYSEYVLTLNVETEIITQFPAVPPSLLCGGENNKLLLYRYLPMGRCLSLLIGRDDEFPIWDEVWVMEPETGEWEKVMSIDSESQKRALRLQGVVSSSSEEDKKEYAFYPVGWLKFREVLVFRSSIWSILEGHGRTHDGTGFCIAYNVGTHEIESFDLDFSPHRFIVHTNSLVWLDGC